MKVIIGFILTILFPGSIQLYYKQYKVGILIILSYIILTGIFVSTGLVYRFAFFIGYLILYISLSFYAFFNFYQKRKIKLNLSLPALFLLTIMLIATSFFIRIALFDSSIKPYKIKNNSMEPIFYKGDFILGGKHFNLTDLKKGQCVVYWDATTEKNIISQIVDINDSIIIIKKPKSDIIVKESFRRLVSVCQFVYISSNLSRIGKQL